MTLNSSDTWGSGAGSHMRLVLGGNRGVGHCTAEPPPDLTCRRCAHVTLTSALQDSPTLARTDYRRAAPAILTFLPHTHSKKISLLFPLSCLYREELMVDDREDSDTVKGREKQRYSPVQLHLQCCRNWILFSFHYSATFKLQSITG
jgi:hypothetical protein